MILCGKLTPKWDTRYRGSFTLNTRRCHALVVCRIDGGKKLVQVVQRIPHRRDG